MDNSEYQRTWFKRRYAQDPQFRSHRQEISRDYRRERYASDPQFGNGCLDSSRKSRLKRRHGIIVGRLDAQLAAQRGACACCHQELGRVWRIDHPAQERYGSSASGATGASASFGTFSNTPTASRRTSTSAA